MDCVKKDCLVVNMCPHRVTQTRYLLSLTAGFKKNVNTMIHIIILQWSKSNSNNSEQRRRGRAGYSHAGEAEAISSLLEVNRALLLLATSYSKKIIFETELVSYNYASVLVFLILQIILMFKSEKIETMHRFSIPNGQTKSILSIKKSSRLIRDVFGKIKIHP